MSIEIYKVRLRNELFVFVTANSSDRLNEISNVLTVSGGRLIASGALSFDTGLMPSASAIRDVFEHLQEGECIYVVGPDGDNLSYSMLVEAETTGGITVGS